jgi:transporter family protein
MKLLIVIMVMALVDSASCLLTSKGMKQVGEISTLHPRKLLGVGRRMVKNRLLVLGFVLQASTFFMFLTVLSWADLSFVVPMAAIGYVISLLGAKFFLKEQVSKERWLGTLLIGAGVVMVLLNEGMK